MIDHLFALRDYGETMVIVISCCDFGSARKAVSVNEAKLSQSRDLRFFNCGFKNFIGSIRKYIPL